MKKIAVLGLWHLGLVSTVGFAQMGYMVIALETDRKKAEKLKLGKLPIYEPGLEEKFKKFLKTGHIEIATSESSVADCHYTVVAFDTPISESGNINIFPIIAAIKKIAPYLNVNVPLIISSQIPIGTSEKIEKIIQNINSNWKSGVVYIPENLKLGEAMNRFLNPDMIVIGSNAKSAQIKAENLYRPIKTKKLIMSLRSAEMIKHALNIFLATTITFGNEIAILCNLLGAESRDVISALRYDNRIGYAPINPGLGFSGGTLARDIGVLKKLSSKASYHSTLLKSILSINQATFNAVLKKLVKRLGSLQRKTIGILGLVYKPGTSTMRSSPAIKLAKKFKTAGAIIKAYDPLADAEEFKKYSKLLARSESVIELVKDCDALVLVTQWPEFKNLDYIKLGKLMNGPYMLDAKNFLDYKTLEKAGFEYESFIINSQGKKS